MPATDLTAQKSSATGQAETLNRSRAIPQWVWLLGCVGIPLLFLFIQSFQPGSVLFVNDTTLGQLKAAPHHLPEGFTGIWHSGAWVGIEGPAIAPTLSALLMLIFPPEIFLKLYAPVSLAFLGFCAWVFFRQLKFNPPVCLLGAIAAALNMHFFSVACWGLGAWNMAAGMIFLALAALSNKSMQLWAKGILAGLAVGMNLMEGFDLGVILSIYVGLYIIWRIFTGERTNLKKVASTFFTEIIVILFAGLVAAHGIFSLVNTQVEGVASASQDTQTKEQRWAPNTRWSLPKMESLQVIVPGLFGYRMIQHITTPDKSSAYWGSVGEDPRVADLKSDDPARRAKAIDTFALPEQQQNKDLNSADKPSRLSAVDAFILHNPGLARYSGTGEYAGVLVSLLAIFALINSWRGGASPYSRGERRLIWFWGAAALFSLVAAWGRHAFLYRLLYQLPYVSTIRNPIKFMHPFHLIWVILAAYGLEALWRRYLRNGLARTSLLPDHLRKWWSTAVGFEKKWTTGCMAIVAAAILGLFIFNACKPHLIEHLMSGGFNAAQANQITSFSFEQGIGFVVCLLVSTGLVIAVISGAWNGRQAKSAWIFLGLIMILDLARADQPWIRYFDYKKAYSSNSVVDFLKDKPYEHRVDGRISPKGVGSGMNTPMGQLYDYWQQNDFPYHNIESLDFSQWPRVPAMDAAYLKNFALKNSDLMHADLWPSVRLWELTNTRYIVSLSALAPLLNNQMDAQHFFTIKTLLKLTRKPGVDTVEDNGDMTVTSAESSEYAMIEFLNALPRAKLYSNWQTPTNDAATLQTLLSHDFDPNRTVLIAPNTPAGQPSGDPKPETGTVSITDYQPKKVELSANAASPAVLLLNDRFAPEWKVWVDQKPAPLLRCNYLMRGVYLTPGEHTVEFKFQPSNTPLYFTLGALAIGAFTAGFVVFSRKQLPISIPAPIPVPPTRTIQTELPPPSPTPDKRFRAKQKRKK